MDRSRIVASSNVILWRAVGAYSEDLQEGIVPWQREYKSQLMRTADVSLQLDPARACCDQA